MTRICGKRILLTMLNVEQKDRVKRATGARNRLALAMELAHVTQLEVEAATGFAQSYISRIAAGRYTDLPGETMRTFARYFGCSIEDLFPGPDDQPRPERRRAVDDRRKGGRRRSNRLTQPDRRKESRR